MGRLRIVRVKYDDGTERVCGHSGSISEHEATSYYIGQQFDHGVYPAERMVTAVAAECLGFMVTCPHCGHGQSSTGVSGICDLGCCNKSLGITCNACGNVQKPEHFGKPCKVCNEANFI